MGRSRDELKRHVFAFLTSARLDEFPDTSKKDVRNRFDACSAFRTAVQLHEPSVRQVRREVEKRMKLKV